MRGRPERLRSDSVEEIRFIGPVPVYLGISITVETKGDHGRMSLDSLVIKTTAIRTTGSQVGCLVLFVLE
jgi:hypothetical protein